MLKKVEIDVSNDEIVQAVVDAVWNYWYCSEEARQVIFTMGQIIRDKESTEEEKEGAKSTIIFTLFYKCRNFKVKKPAKKE